jgi:hypothetical protein
LEGQPPTTFAEGPEIGAGLIVASPQGRNAALTPAQAHLKLRFCGL